MPTAEEKKNMIKPGGSEMEKMPQIIPSTPYVQKTIGSPSGDVTRDVTEMTGQKVTMYNKRTGEAKQVERNLTPSFEGAYSFTNPNAASTNANNNVVSGSSAIRDEITDNKNVASDIQKTLQNASSFDTAINDTQKSIDLTELDTIKEDMYDLSDSIKNGLLTDAQRESIRVAGEQAASQYDPLIADSEEEARIGKPKALAGSGAKGGFMNTQFAGTSALQGSDTFAGKGGVLERVNSAYDKITSDLKAKQNVARQAAEQAALTAIETGKRSDLSFLQDMYDKVVETKKLESDLNAQRLDAITKLQEQEQARVETNLTNASQAVIGALTGDTAMDAEMIGNIATQYKIDENQLKAYVKDYQMQQATEMFDIAKNLDTDQTYEMPDGTVITGTNKVAGGGYETTFQTANGQNMMITYDGEGNIIKQTSLGSAYKDTGSGSGTSDAEKEIKAFQADAASMIQNLDKGDLTWAAAFDVLKTKYPMASDEKINEQLGGGIPYKEGVGFDTDAAWGRAVAKEED